MPARWLLGTFLTLAILGATIASADPSRRISDCALPDWPQRVSGKCASCGCPDDYRAKCLPCPPCWTESCAPDDYCAKRCKIRVCKAACGGPDDYCPKCCVVPIPPLCRPWYICGPRCGQCSLPCTLCPLRPTKGNSGS